MTDEGLKICLFGASGDNSNLGVSALMYAVVSGVLARDPRARLTVFDNGWGMRSDRIQAGGEAIGFDRCGARLSHRFYRRESFSNIRLCSWLGGGWNPGARRLMTADAVLDASAGDSFTDLYGERRFRSVIEPKRLALARRKPLILLPQTYGPFHSSSAREAARDVLLRARAAWTRDPAGVRALQDLLGDAFDPARHRQGVDLAFLLRPQPPDASIARPLLAWLEGGGSEEPAVGVNISGLLYNDPDAARRYGLRADYRAAMRDFVTRLLTRTAARVILVPHVVTRKEGRLESDQDASRHLSDSLDADLRDRVRIAPLSRDARHMKWIISRLGWFCGARMHSTIAAMSSGVPAAGIAYSIKMEPVFETCGIPDQVVDARSLDTEELVERLWGSWTDRAEVRRCLGLGLPDVLERASRQLDTIVADCRRVPHEQRVA